MNKTTLVILFSLCICFSLQSSLFAGASNLEELEKTVAASLSGVKEISTDIVQTMTMGAQGTVTVNGTIFYQVPDKMRMALKTTMMGQEMNSTVINDGTIMWTETQMGEMKQIMKMNMAELRQMENYKALSGMKSESLNFDQVFHPLKNMKDNYNIKWLGKDKAENLDLAYVEATMTDKGKERLAAMGQAGQAAITYGSFQKMAFDTKTGFLKKLSSLNSQGEEVMTIEFSNYCLQPKLEKDFFVYSAPEGTNVIDMTPMMKGMLENLAGESEKNELAPQPEKASETGAKDQGKPGPALDPSGREISAPEEQGD